MNVFPLKSKTEREMLNRERKFNEPFCEVNQTDATLCIEHKVEIHTHYSYV